MSLPCLTGARLPCLQLATLPFLMSPGMLKSSTLMLHSDVSLGAAPCFALAWLLCDPHYVVPLLQVKCTTVQSLASLPATSCPLLFVHVPFRLTAPHAWTAGRTHDRAVFSLVPGDQPAEGLEEVLARYRHLVPHVKLAGPTSFAPLIDTAMRLVIESCMQYHILVSAVSRALVQGSPVTPLSLGSWYTQVW